MLSFTARPALRGTLLVATAVLLLLGGGTARGSEFPPGYAPSVAAHPRDVPSSTLNPEVDPAKGYAVQRISGHVYFVTDGIYQAMFVVTRAGVVLVDAPPTLGTKIPKAIAEITKRPVRYFIYSHEHADHVGSAHLFRSTATFIAQRSTRDRLRADRDPKRPVPTRSFSKRLDLRIGGERLELVYPGDNHEAGNSFIWLPSEKVLMAVDIVFAGHVPFKSLAESEDIRGWITAHDQLLRYPFRVIVGGHFGLSTRTDVLNQRRYVQDLERHAAEGIGAVDVPSLVQRIGYDHPWQLFKAYLDAASQTCADRTLATWRAKLVEADVFTFSNCETMVNAVRIRFGGLGPFGDGG